MEIERETSNFLVSIQQYLRSRARSLNERQSQVTLNWQQVSHEEVILEDSQKRKFRINYSQVDSYIQGLGLKDITSVTAHKWELDLRFNMLHPISIRFDSLKFTIHTPSRSHEFDGPLLTFSVFPQPLKLEDLPKAVKGYLNRIGKVAHIARIQYNVVELPNLLRFIPNQRFPFIELGQMEKQRKEIKKRQKMEVENKDPIEQLNSEGLAILNKIHKILTGRQIFDFVKNQQIKNPLNAKAILRIIEESKASENHPKRK